MIDFYQPPPYGDSKIEDFNPTVHLRTAKEIVDGDSINSEQEIVEKILAKFIDRPEQLWLHLEPNSYTMSGFLIDALLEGKACLREFERRSRNPDLNKY